MTGHEQERGQFAGKVAVVTGGSRGIGRAIARELAARGADIAFNYLKNHSAARETQSAVEALGVKCLRVRSHLADPEAIASLFARIGDEFGRLDILVNNAASGVMRPATELDVRHWDWTLDINARAPWLCSVEAAKLMQRGGRIVNISSPRGNKGPHQLLRGRGLKGGAGSRHEVPGNGTVPARHRRERGVGGVRHDRRHQRVSRRTGREGTCKPTDPGWPDRNRRGRGESRLVPVQRRRGDDPRPRAGGGRRRDPPAQVSRFRACPNCGRSTGFRPH